MSLLVQRKLQQVSLNLEKKKQWKLFSPSPLTKIICWNWTIQIFPSRLKLVTLHVSSWRFDRFPLQARSESWYSPSNLWRSVQFRISLYLLDELGETESDLENVLPAEYDNVEIYTGAPIMSDSFDFVYYYINEGLYNKSWSFSLLN